MTLSETSAALPALALLRDQIAELADSEPQEVRAGHLDLGADLWLSSDPLGQARLLVGGDAGGALTLEVDEADSGRWACLGLRVQPQELVQARHAGLLLSLRSPRMISCRLVLRCFLPGGGFEDRPMPEPALLPPGGREVLLHVPVERGQAEQAVACELNLFFLDNSLRAEALRLEPLLML